MRSSISSGDIPLNCQITVATGSGIAGKMSTGVVRIATSPPMRTRMAPQTKVYGRRSATRTIHIIGRPYRSRPSRAASVARVIWYVNRALTRSSSAWTRLC